MDGVDELPGVLQAAAIPDAVRAADPAGVDEISRGSMNVKLGREHLGVGERMPDEEWRSEASREGCLRLGHALLRSGDLGRVARDEVVHDLVLRELGDGREHPEGVAGQEDDLLGVVVHLRWDPRVGDELQRVGHPRVLRDRDVVEVHLVRVLVEDNIFEDRAEADGVVNLRLLLTREPDALGVAAALDVEDAARVPDVLVVADELPLGVRAQRRLPRAAQAEEDGDVVVLADVG
mmetsp:Transcript_61823/g.191526  ORF Transcript_61823/g.191526 Transcript_61823/m.191526 type:complete len:235 (-) Transcript_61823:234-938(-)